MGYLYARVDRSPLRSVQLAIALLTVLLAVTISVFLLQFRKQASVISRTTIELEEKRQELVRLERLALAGQLSANILHDLKKPVLNIKSELEEFDADGQQQAPLAEVVQRMREQVGVFLSILREGNLERFVRGEGETEWLSINEGHREKFGPCPLRTGSRSTQVATLSRFTTGFWGTSAAGPSLLELNPERLSGNEWKRDSHDSHSS
ncbi:MAG: hypothetical protein KatS3mg130_1529 [Candidatus Sumerlaea sp.]|nr:MAG: hypothetical protein KatS3mg130_1529 [Candidatus Sumerlaea sp.]